MEKQSYKTINKIFSHEIDKIKASRFIGIAIPVKTEDDVKAEINKLKKKYYDARHHCYAYILDTDDFKYSDDGEPSKTAGLPIYTVLKSSGAVSILVVVIRYFGGTKLGTGGLVKAYTRATQELLSITRFIEIEIKDVIIFKFSYDLTKQVYHVVNLYEGIVQNETYENDVIFEINLNISFLEEFKKELIEKTDGRVVFIK